MMKIFTLDTYYLYVYITISGHCNTLYQVYPLGQVYSLKMMSGSLELTLLIFYFAHNLLAIDFTPRDLPVLYILKLLQRNERTLQEGYNSSLTQKHTHNGFVSPRKGYLIGCLNKNGKRFDGNLNRGILAVNFYALTFQSRLYIIVCHFMIRQHNCKEKYAMAHSTRDKSYKCIKWTNQRI